MGELFKHILSRIAERTRQIGSVILLPHTTIPISDKAFKPIMAQAAKRIAFVDGGNAEILKAPNFSLQLIRLYAAVYEDNTRVSRIKKEFYALIVAQGTKTGLTYEVETFNTDFSLQHSFAADDATLRTGIHLATPSAVVDAVRTFAEFALAQEVCNKLRTGDILVRDGDLMPTQTYSMNYLNELKRTATQRGVILCGLSKTTTILTDAGNSAAAALNIISPAGTWLYQLPGANIAFVKLHSRSKYVFRLDVTLSEHARQAAFALMSQATDPVFLGYPYGLIEADQFAQVPGNETSRLKLEIRAHGGNELSKYLTALNAHDVLNKL